MLLFLPSALAQTPTPREQLTKPFTITVDQPAYAGLPVWVHKAPGPEFVRYPFYTSVEYFGCNRLELMRDGKLVRRWQIRSDLTSYIGIACGSAAPPQSPEDRLPLHLWYPLQDPGVYRVRWIYEQPTLKNGSEQTISTSSAWTTFTVLQSTPAQRERWLNQLLASCQQR